VSIGRVRMCGSAIDHVWEEGKKAAIRVTVTVAVTVTVTAQQQTGRWR